MKKIITSASLIAAMMFGIESQAQEITFGVKAGYSFSTLRTPKKMDVSGVSRIGSYNVGTYIDIPFGDGFSLQTGLAVNGKGAHLIVGDNTTSTYTTYDSNPYYLELPVNAIAKIAIGDIFDKCNIIMGGGPYVATGVGGKSTVEGKLLNKSFSSKDNILFSNDDQPVNSKNYYGEIKNYDFGLNALVGIEYHWATFNLNYCYGAVNVNPGANLTPTDRMKNRVWSASIGVRF